MNASIYCIPGIVTTCQEDVIKAVVTEFNHQKSIANFRTEKRQITTEDLFHKTRKYEIVECRRIAIVILMLFYDYHTKDSAAIFSRDHATSIHHRRIFFDSIQYNRNYAKLVGKILDRLIISRTRTYDVIGNIRNIEILL
jgi:chromosomal replication initiation ATPase DnaA